MNEQRPDFELLRQFVHQKDQAAFASVVRRHLDLVYGTALRKVTDPGAAEELVQDVFAALARNAWRFGVADSVPAWLHRTTLNQANEWWRAEYRRRRREQTAAELGTTMKTPDEQPALRALVPMLDEALLSLREKDRAALLLRFHENQTFRDLGASLGVGEAAAQKRVAAAVEKVAQFFRRRGFKTATVAATTAALWQTAIPAPAPFAVSMTQVAMQIAPPGFLGVAAISRFAALTTVQKAMVGVALLAIPLAWYWTQNAHAETAVAMAAPSFAPAPADAPVVMAEVSPSPSQAPAEPEPAVVPASVTMGRPYTARLTGLIDVPGFKAAVLEVSYFVTNVIPNEQRRFEKIVVSRTNSFAVKEGEAVSEWNYKAEILEVHAESGTVKVNEAGESIVYTFDSPENPPPDGAQRPNVRLQNAEFASVLKVLCHLTDRTALYHPRLAPKSITLASTVQSRAEAAESLRTAFREIHVSTVLDGERFEWVVPEALVQSLAQPSAPARSSVTNADTPTGQVSMGNLPLRQFLRTYADWIGRKLVETDPLAGSPINFKTQTPLTREELVYAFETLLAWQGFKVVLVDDKSFKVVRSN